MTGLTLFLAGFALWCAAMVWLATHPEAERRADTMAGLALIGAVGVACALMGGCVGRELAAPAEAVAKFPRTDESGSDAISKGGLWEGAALYDVSLTNGAHLVVLYDTTTGTVAMCPWPDPDSPETGWLYVSPLDRRADDDAG